MTEENSRRGLANKRAGNTAMHRAVTWLRGEGKCPSAEKTASPGRGDMVTGVGDINVEVTVESWQAIGAKADQAARDARALGYSNWAIWKPRRGVGDMGRAWCVTEWRQLWSLMREVDELRFANDVLRAAVRADFRRLLVDAGFSAADIRRMLGAEEIRRALGEVDSDA